MNNKIITNNGSVYSLDDFKLSNLLKNESLLNELQMQTLPETFLSIFGVEKVDSFKPILLKKIELYDKSKDVNSFIYQNKQYWLDKQQRSGIKTIAESGLDTVDIVLEDCIVTLPSEAVKRFITNLEVYAYKCFVNTTKHLQNIKPLWKPQDILNYDYTTGYPEKVILK